MISHTADVREFGALIAADCCEISMHARAHVCIERGFTILGAEDDVNNDFTQRLRHEANDDRTRAGSESRFQR